MDNFVYSAAFLKKKPPPSRDGLWPKHNSLIFSRIFGNIFNLSFNYMLQDAIPKGFTLKHMLKIEYHPWSRLSSAN